MAKTGTEKRTARPGLVPPETIGFRLDDDSGGVLFERAKQLGTSPHELARYYVLEALQLSEERSVLRTAIQQLQERQKQFETRIAFAVRALLTSAGKVPPDKADEWIAATFKQT